MVILNYLGEIWKDIPDYEGKYQASNFGRIKSLKFGKEKILKLRKNNRGYLNVSLSINCIVKTYRVHRLVWSAFHGEIPEGYEINHIDEDKTNNRLDNLELVTRKENINWGTAIQRRSKTVLQYDLEGNLINNWSSTSEIKRELGLNQGFVSACCRGKAKSAYGYIWKYKENVG